MAAPDYIFYTANGGTLTEESFLAALPRATAAVDAFIWPNVVSTASLDAYKRAVCAVCDLDPTEGLVASESVGDAQVSYNSPNVLAMAGISANPIDRLIRPILTGTNLLYRGL